MPLDEIITISEIDREDFGSLCICAVRYCLGRRTYMPTLIQRIVSSHLRELSDKDLGVLRDDIINFGGPIKDIDAYGDYDDFMAWSKFLHAINTEIQVRESNQYDKF